MNQGGKQKGLRSNTRLVMTEDKEGLLEVVETSQGPDGEMNTVHKRCETAQGFAGPEGLTRNCLPVASGQQGRGGQSSQSGRERATGEVAYC